MGLTHIDSKNNPTMVDVSDKEVTTRIATARTIVNLPESIASEINDKGELNLKKGPVFQTAIIAGTMAVKKTSDLIPFCHPLLISSAKIKINQISNKEIEILCTVKIEGKTGVEMEALTGATVTALTIYDMCKAISHEIQISSTQLVDKSGGKRNIIDGKLCD
jgi:cyclic pyranopterin phosphate synthase